MFLIAGISPRIKTLDPTPQICPVCGLAQAYFKRVDHYLSFFFIPLLRVKKGEPLIICDRCEKDIRDFKKDGDGWPSKLDVSCNSCGKRLNRDFIYCPYCGKPTNK